LSWCEPSTYAEEQETFTTAAAPEAQVDAEYSVEEGLVTPAFQSAVDSVQVSFEGTGTRQEQDKMAEQESKDVAALEATFEADAASKQEEEQAVEDKQQVTLAEQATEEEQEVTLAELATENNSMLKNATKTAGTLALGVAGAALLSALAIDVADTAILGAVAAAAGGAVLSGTGPKASRKSTAITEEGDEEAENDDIVSEKLQITGAGETGVIIAAGLLSALDAGRSMVDSVTNMPSARATDIDEAESTKMDEE